MKLSNLKMRGTWLLLMFAAGSFAVGQETKKPADADVKAEVPELTQFHEVIYKIWHTAWPSKDVAMLKELSGEVGKLGDELCSAQLPGILREKKPVWEKNVEKMKSILAEYKISAAGNDGDRLLKAAEQLHAQYEAMVRVLRPVVKEVDDFHSALYPLYHYYMPQKDTVKIRESINLLRIKFGPLSNATLPSKLKEKQGAFDEARKRLGASLSSLEHAMASTPADKLDKQIETMHSSFENLNKVFE